MEDELIAHWREVDRRPQYLWDHLRETAAYSGMAADKIGLKEVGEILGWMHDLGKASQEFQQYLRSRIGLIDPDSDEYLDPRGHKGKIDHSTAGAQLIFNSLHGHRSVKEIAAEILPLCVASHHTGLMDVLSPTGNCDFTDRMNKLDKKTHLSEILNTLSLEEQQFLKKILEAEAPYIQLVEKLKSIKDSQDHQDTYLFKCGLLIRYLFSCLIDADRQSTADFENPQNKSLKNNGYYQSWDVLAQRLENAINTINQQADHTEVNELRQQVSDDCFNFAENPYGLYQLTVPTGGGKTLSSLRFGIRHAQKHNLDHIFYIIPYTSIIDQNAEKVRNILEDRDVHGTFLDRIVLEHHSNLTPDEESRRHNLLAENWDAPIIFTTQVQFLETLFGSGTRNARRMHQLANSVLIFDEIQTLPVRCVHLFNLAVRFLVNNCNSTVVLCTATQPLLDKVEPAQRALPIEPEQHIIQDESKLFQVLKRVQVFDERKTPGWTNEEISDLVNQQLLEKGNVLVVVNTKKSARILYETIAAKKLGDVYHLSTNMCPQHRLDVLAEVKQKLLDHKPVICVSTQLIEAGIDIDFNSVIRYLAGLDSITQAAGRCNREGRPGMGNTWIVNPAEENLEKLPDIRKGIEAAESILDQFNRDPELFDHDRLGFKAIQAFYKQYFYQRQREMCYPIDGNSPAGRNDNLFNLLSLNELSLGEYINENKIKPTIPFIQSFRTAAYSFAVIETATQGVLVPYDKGKDLIAKISAAYDLPLIRKELRKAQRYSVNLYLNQIRSLAGKRAIYEIPKESGIFSLREDYYSDHFGWSEEAASEIENLIL